jgi:hypothetical protein
VLPLKGWIHGCLIENELWQSIRPSGTAELLGCSHRWL